MLGGIPTVICKTSLLLGVDTGTNCKYMQHFVFANASDNLHKSMGPIGNVFQKHKIKPKNLKRTMYHTFATKNASLNLLTYFSVSACNNSAIILQ